MKTGAARVFASLLAVALATGCTAPEPAGPEGEALLLVTIDTLRGDRIGAGGDARARTPYFDRLARRGVQLAVAVSAVPLTLPSHATILSGRMPPEHGARDNGLFRVRDDVPLLSEALRDDGWTTAAFLAAYPLAARFGLGRGFDVYRDSLGTRSGGSSFAERTADTVVDEATAWLPDSGRRVFLWLHFFDPHAPYEPPAPWGPATADRYRGEIAFTDRQLGRALRALRSRFASVRVCCTADHGESLGEHGEDTHGVFVYESTTRVPLVFRGPGAVPRVERRPVSLAVVSATMASWAGLGTRATDFGTPLALAPGDPPGPEPDKGLYMETLYPELRHGWAPLRALRTDRWKVIRAPEPEIYDLRADPGETRNLWSEPEARRRVDALVTRLEEPRREHTTPPAAIDPEVEEALRSLGYAGARTTDTAPGQPLPDPKERVRLERLLGRAGGALEAGNLAAARSILSSALSIDPRNKETHLLRARLEAARGAFDQAADIFDYCLELPPPSLDAVVYYERGRTELDAGEPLLADASFESAVRHDPLNVDALFNWGVAAYRTGRYDEACERWERVLALDPNHPSAREWLPKSRKLREGEDPE